VTYVHTSLLRKPAWRRHSTPTASGSAGQLVHRPTQYYSTEGYNSEGERFSFSLSLVCSISRYGTLKLIPRTCPRGSPLGGRKFVTVIHENILRYHSRNVPMGTMEPTAFGPLQLLQLVLDFSPGNVGSLQCSPNLPA